MALDDATKTLLAELAGGDDELSVEGMRAFGAEMAARWGEGPDMARVVRHGPTIELVPHGEPRGTIVFFHGGGWVAGSPDEIEALGRVLAERTTCTVLLAAYRLAPEHPFPAAVEDALAAVRWAADRAAGRPLIVAGDSAGANLAAVAALELPDVALQVLIEPVTDADTATASYLDPENQVIVTRELMEWFFGHYAPAERDDPRLAPLRAASLEGAPPAVILTAEHDVLRDEGEAYAERLRAAGVEVSHRRFAGQMHGFFGMLGVLPGSAAGIDYVVAAIERYCAV
jgi:acetyl esterase